MESTTLICGISLQGWGTLASIFVALVTGILAYATWKMAKATEKTLEAQNKPYVIVYAQQKEDAPHTIQIVVENTGTAPAYDIKFTLSDNFYLCAWGIEKADKAPSPISSGVFIDGIKQLTPSQKRIFNWGHFGGIEEALGGKPANIIVKFKDAAKKEPYSTENTLDINDFRVVTADTPTSVRQFQEVEKIQKILGKTNELLNKKLQPQSLEATYMWAFLAYKLLEGKYPREYILQYSTGAGLTSEQQEHAENEAGRLLKQYRPDLISEEA